MTIKELKEKIKDLPDDEVIEITFVSNNPPEEIKLYAGLILLNTFRVKYA